MAIIEKEKQSKNIIAERLVGKREGGTPFLEPCEMDYTIDGYIGIGGKRWDKEGYERIYFDITPEMIGLEVDLYNTGNIHHAKYKGEEISNTQALKIWDSVRQGKVWYDIADNTMNNKYIDKKYFTDIVQHLRTKRKEWFDNHKEDRVSAMVKTIEDRISSHSWDPETTDLDKIIIVTDSLRKHNPDKLRRIDEAIHQLRERIPKN